jgi:hypothetical protein
MQKVQDGAGQALKQNSRVERTMRRTTLQTKTLPKDQFLNP